MSPANRFRRCPNPQSPAPAADERAAKRLKEGHDACISPVSTRNHVERLYGAFWRTDVRYLEDAEQNIPLMRLALARNSPVTEADLRQRWAERGLDPDKFDLPPDALT